MMIWKILGAILSFVFVIAAVAVSSIAWAGNTGRTEAAVLPPTVITPTASYIGSLNTSAFNGKNYVMYRSIPFAKPPVGKLRFMRPQPLELPSGKMYDNSETFKPSCWTITRPSTDPNYGEDCLYLNVYVPDGSSDAQRRFPVMVWIHGGGFVAGNTFPEPVKMVTRGDVVVVTVNYRMGIFGFLTTQDNKLPANNGLWDMQFALQWVKDNIQYFKGDDTSITVFGESAGAISTALLALSPVSGKLFHKAILQSGSATSTILSRDSRLRAQEFGVKVGCPANATSIQLAKCLRQVGITDILKNSQPAAFNITSARKQGDFIWTPTVDGEIVPANPLSLLSNTTYLKNVGALDKDYVIGVLNNEGGLISENFLNVIPLSTVCTSTFIDQLLDYLLYSRYQWSSQKDDVIKAVKNFYNVFSCNVTHPQNVLDIAADLLFVVPALEMASALSGCSSTVNVSWHPVSASPSYCSNVRPSKIFFYHFDSCSPPSNINKPQCMIHGSEVALEFPRNPIADPVQNQLSDTFIDLLTSFAHNSTPGSAVESGWPTFDRESQTYLRLDSNASVRLRPYHYRANFWLNTVPRLVGSFV